MTQQLLGGLAGGILKGKAEPGVVAVVGAFWPLGLWFAAAIALGMYLWTGDRRATLTVLVTTMLAWIAIVALAWLALSRGAIGGLVPLAGAVGAVLTHLGCSLVVPSLRQLVPIALTGFAGLVTSMIGAPTFLNIFPLWQGAVAFCIGVGLGLSTVSTAAPAAPPVTPAAGPAPAVPPPAATGTPPPATPSVPSPPAAEGAAPAAQAAGGVQSGPQSPVAALVRRLLGARSGF